MPAEWLSVSVSDSLSIGRCLAQPSAHNRIYVTQDQQHAINLRDTRLMREHTAQHATHVRNGSVSRYCSACEDARHHTLHRRYKQGNPRCHLCTRLTASRRPARTGRSE
jgi:hypothetical protein